MLHQYCCHFSLLDKSNY